VTARPGYSMIFVASKVFWAVATPGNLLLLLLAGLLAQANGRRRGFRLALDAGLALLVIAALPLDDWLAAPLEARFSTPTLPAQIDGIIVLRSGCGRHQNQREAHVLTNPVCRLAIIVERKLQAITLPAFAANRSHCVRGRR
jgi:hypothetical protein